MEFVFELEVLVNMTSRARSENWSVERRRRGDCNFASILPTPRTSFREGIKKDGEAPRLLILLSGDEARAKFVVVFGQLVTADLQHFSAVSAGQKS